MTERAKDMVSYKRLAAAIAIVAAIVVAVPLSDAVLRALDAQSAVVVEPVGLNAGALLQGDSAEDVMTRLEEAAAAEGTAGDAPAWFQGEIGFLPGARDVRVGSGGAVVGYIVSGDCGDVLEQLCAHMGKHGWSSVPLGEVCGATFVKEGGTCAWALATCTQVSSSTSVVFRCQVKAGAAG